jgi:hypothetical protein
MLKNQIEVHRKGMVEVKLEGISIFTEYPYYQRVYNGVGLYAARV